jgi:curli biogenesis system outer membrane secretion channel CsgG
MCWFVAVITLAFGGALRADEAGATVSSSVTPAARKPVVAVVDFGAKSTAITIAPGMSAFTWDNSYVDLLNSELITALVNDRSFDVMDRARLRDLAKERNLTSVTPAELSKLGLAGGADYIVCGDIELVELTRNLQQYPGYEQTQYQGHMVINVRLVDVRTTRVQLARKVNVRLKLNLNQYNSVNVTPVAFMEQVKAEAVRRIVTSISEGISPIQIRAIHDGKVYLNRGEQAFVGGEELEIVVPVETIYDENGEILDVVEEKAGKVRVDTVRAKTAIATIVDEGRPLQIGWIARRIETAE